MGLLPDAFHVWHLRRNEMKLVLDRTMTVCDIKMTHKI